MLTIDLMGGLGNQIFQIFTLINYSIKFNQDYFIPYELISNRNKNNTQRLTYWDTFFVFIKHKLTKKYDQKSNGFSICNEHTLKEYSNIKLMGFFQDEKFFKENYQQILNILKIPLIRNTIKDKYNYLFQGETISLHFRLGDYKYRQGKHPILDINYYINSLNYICNPNKKYNIIYFCEKEDLDIIEEKLKLLKKPNLNFIYITNKFQDWTQLFLMSLCNHNIIANSSFSWWGAYLNDNPNKIVCYPKNWFGERNDRTYNIPNWIKI